MKSFAATLAFLLSALGLQACATYFPLSHTPSVNEGRDSIPSFDADAAFANLKMQVECGPRVPNTPGHSCCLALLRSRFETAADSVALQSFPYQHPVLGVLNLSNVITRFGPSGRPRLLLSAHWDTRPWADGDPDSSMRSSAVPGANDGASGVAVLMELARCLRMVSPPIGVDIVLFDGEDLGTNGEPGSWCIGSRFFARNLEDPDAYAAAINLDMIGGSSLRITREAHGDAAAKPLTDLLFGIAAELGEKAFVDESGMFVTDDHVPLQEEGIPAVDLIDLDYSVNGRKLWHTVDDVPAHCSPESLRSVGTLLLHFMYRHAHQLQERPWK